ncbi:MAG: hypothetical protein HGA36_00755 [Candidatus Moranbacteria bacterium]|nr:hypothetical protein [Candidatus Moranbacteria bacterium]
MSKKSDQAVKVALSKRAIRMGETLLSRGAGFTCVKDKYAAIRARIKSGNGCTCETCNGAMPLFVDNIDHFLRTTCSDSCEEKLQLAKKEVDEEKITWGSFESSSIFKDLLPEHLQIMANLNVRQYDGAKVTIFAADLEEVERLGIHALVSISHNSDTLPMKVRIAAFAESEQYAIVTSLMEGIPINEAKSLIMREFMKKFAHAGMACGKSTLS